MLKHTFSLVCLVALVGGHLAILTPQVQAEEAPFQIAQSKKKKPEDIGPTAMPLPKFYARHVEEGNKLLSQNKIQEAMNEFFSARTINPDYYPTYVSIGNAYKKMGNIRKAADNYQLAVKLLNPSYASNHVKRGDYLISKGKYERAIRDYWEVLRIDPQAGNQYTLAMRHLRFNNEKKAIKAFEAAMTLDKDYPDPFFQLGNVYFKKSKFDKAIENYDAAVKHDPENPVYNYYAGNAHYSKGTVKKKGKSEMGEVRKAIVLYEKAIGLGLSKPHVHFNLGTSYILDDKYDNAISHLQKAIKQGQQDEDSYFNLGNAFFKKAMTIDYVWDERYSITKEDELNKNNAKFDLLLKSIKGYTLAIKHKKDFPQIYFDLGVSYYRIAELKPTDQFISKLIKPETEKDYYQKGMKFFKVDMLTRAIANFRMFTSYSSDRKARKLAFEVITDLESQLNTYR